MGLSLVRPFSAADRRVIVGWPDGRLTDSRSAASGRVIRRENVGLRTTLL